jgi:hypothetical protein
MAAAGLNYCSIQFHLDYFSRGVLQDTAQAAAVATAYDEHSLRPSQGDEGRVHHHLVIDELVLLCGLKDVIEDQGPAEGDSV